jgi:hypothetical protein
MLKAQVGHHFNSGSLFRFVFHILTQATKFNESELPSNVESSFNCIKSTVVSTVTDQTNTKADVVELNVRLMEEKDGRENAE